MAFGGGNPDFLRSRSSGDLQQDLHDLVNFRVPKHRNFGSDDDEEATGDMAGLFGARKVRPLGNAPRKRERKSAKKTPLTVKFGKINVTLKQGIYFDKEVDAVVNSTSGSLHLSAGQASRAMLEKAGHSMQEECSKKYPDGIKRGEIAETGGHALHSGYVFHVCLPCWTQENALEAEQMFEDVITKVLHQCDEYNLDSIAIPPVGTGFLNFSAGTVARKLLLAVQSFEKTNYASELKEVKFVIREEDTKHYEDFETEMRKFSYTNMQTPDLKMYKWKGRPESKVPKVRKMVGKVKVDLVTGSLTDQKVDVIVNITNESLQLNEGALSRAILKAAGQNLQQECNNAYQNGVDIGDVARTSAYELQHIKAIYHTALPIYDKSQRDSQEMIIYLLVQRCLSVASEEKYQSIAFSTVGCGYQGFPSKSAAKLVTSAIDDFCDKTPASSLREIIVVVFDGDRKWRELWKDFETEWDKLDKKKPAVKKAMPKEVKSPQIPVPPPPKRGSAEWFKMKYEEDICVPKYWTSVKGGENVKRCQKQTSKDYELVDVDSATEYIIKQLVMRSWEQDKVGSGKDARNLDLLGFKSLKISKIQRVENLYLYKAYGDERQRLFDKACKKGRSFHSPGTVRGSKGAIRISEIFKTLTNTQTFLSDAYPEINEQFLFHGTVSENVDKLLSQGIDNRLAGDRAMFGAGVYTAESSTKADQYSDPRDTRRKTGLQMLLVRMTLGDIYVTDKPQPFKRAPCKRCRKDRCTCKSSRLWDSFDSVMGDGQWIFREFVVYEKRQTYPEYLITYDRV